MALLSGLFDEGEGTGFLGSLPNFATASTDVNRQTALEHPAVYACVRLLSETVATLPLLVYRRMDEGGKERATEHWGYSLLKENPNPRQDAFMFRAQMHRYLEVTGNAYAEIVRRSDGSVRLWPIPPPLVGQIRTGRVEDGRFIKDDTGKLVYRVSPPGNATAMIEEENMLHIKMFPGDGVRGVSPLTKARFSIGAGKAAHRWTERFFENNATPGGVIEHPGKLKKSARDNLRSSWEDAHSGLSDAHRVAILEEGSTFEPISISPDDAQFVEQRNLNLRDIARYYGVQPHMIQDLNDATFSNISEQSLEFVKYTIRPRLVRWEQALNNQLIPGNVRFAEHKVEGLLRADPDTRKDFYASALQNGWMSINEVRERENMNPIEGGDEHRVQLNVAPIDQADQAQANGQNQERMELLTRQISEGDDPKSLPGDFVDTSNERRRLSEQQIEPFAGAFQRIVDRDIRELLPLLETIRSSDDPGDVGWRQAAELEDFWRDVLSDPTDETIRQLIPLLERETGSELSEEWRIDQKEQITREITKNYARSLVSRVRDISEAEDTEKARDQIEGWSEDIPERAADMESHNVVNTATQAGFISGGVVAKRWVAFTDPCPACTSLDGAVVGVSQPFADGKITSGWTASSPVVSPPIHEGCQCQIAASG